MTRDRHGVETCARCGHQSRGCPRCGKTDPFLGSGYGDNKYCHTFSATYPTCYMLATWSQSDLAKEPWKTT